jgi:hypothetical protein
VPSWICRPEFAAKPGVPALPVHVHSVPVFARTATAVPLEYDDGEIDSGLVTLLKSTCWWLQVSTNWRVMFVKDQVGLHCDCPACVPFGTKVSRKSSNSCVRASGP